jgi:hypothetical protein
LGRKSPLNEKEVVEWGTRSFVGRVEIHPSCSNE